jgi:hypothetical protein
MVRIFNILTRVIQKVKTILHVALNSDFAGNVFFFHPSYVPDLAASDFHLFAHLKQFLDGIHMVSNEEVKKTVKDWFGGLAADFCDAGIQNSSHDTTSAQIFRGIMYENDLKSVVMM